MLFLYPVDKNSDLARGQSYLFGKDWKCNRGKLHLELAQRASSTSTRPFSNLNSENLYPGIRTSQV